MSAFQNSTTCFVVQQLDDDMRTDAHNGMIVGSTVLAVVGVQFLFNCYAMYVRYKRKNSPNAMNLTSVSLTGTQSPA
jgi:hypothetical protein